MDYLRACEEQVALHAWGVSCLLEPEEEPGLKQILPPEKRFYRSQEERPGLGSQLAMEPPFGIKEPRFMDLKSDFAFKYVFGKEANKDLLIHFLNSLFEGRKMIRDVWSCPTERLGEDEEHRTVIYDVLCRGNDGEYFLIEMQRVRQDFFNRRAFHYAARLVSGQVPAGKAGDDFEVKEVYFIGLLDFILWEYPERMKNPLRRYLRGWDVTWTDTREPVNQVQWIFIQLPAFQKEKNELGNNLERWIYLMNELSQLPERSACFADPAFRKLFNVTEINELNKEDQRMYKLTIDVARDWRNTVSYAKREGKQEGLKEKELFVVRTMIRNSDFDDEEIAAFVGVEENFVRSVRFEIDR